MLPGLALAALAAGCLTPEDDVVQFVDDFEAGLATWALEGDVSIVTTYHPGEHAARLGPGARMSHALDVRRTIGEEGGWRDGFSDGNWLEYTTDCGGRPTLALEPATSPPGPQVRIRLGLDAPPAPDLLRRKHMLPALPAFVGDGDASGEVRFTALVIEAGARCHLDKLQLMVSGGSIGY